MEKIRLYGNTKHIEFKPGQYLLDVIPSVKYSKDNIIGEKEDFIFKQLSDKGDASLDDFTKNVFLKMAERERK